MEISYGDVRRLEKKFTRMLKKVLSNQESLIQQGVLLMASVQDIRTDLSDTKALVVQLIGFITTNDAEKAALKQQIADLIAAAGIADAAKAALQAEIDAAFTDAEDLENTARAGIPGVPPVGGTPLVPSYVDVASFNAAVAAYTGPERVTLDGVDVKAGTDPSLDYFSHSADGSVSNSGPTD